MTGSRAKGRRGLGHGEGRIDRIQGAGSLFLAAAGLHSLHGLEATRIRSRMKQRRASMATEYLGERGIRERERKPKKKTGGGGKVLACGSTTATRLTKWLSESRSLCASRGARGLGRARLQEAPAGRGTWRRGRRGWGPRPRGVEGAGRGGLQPSGRACMDGNEQRRSLGLLLIQRAREAAALLWLDGGGNQGNLVGEGFGSGGDGGWLVGMDPEGER